MWSEQVALRLAEERSVHTAFAAAFITSLACAVGFATGGTVRRWISSLVLFAAVGGTLLAEPTRNLIAIWIVGA
ncbi:hypothetical protein ACQKM2_08940 [Streptomyces sp. NPDC004126]|uniref:hypothetical protein n=1 Tax=Streptomyces sp. NPDC004126 TaxID=3390695 RepID=UPI003CFCA114